MNISDSYLLNKDKDPAEIPDTVEEANLPPPEETIQVKRPTRKAAQKAKQLFKKVLRVHANQRFKHAWV